jgi:transposase
MGTKQDLQAIEAQRLAGARMLKRRVPQAEVARQSGLSRQAVSVWARQLAEVNGVVGKLKVKPLGRPQRLDAEQREALSCMLVAGALQAGFGTELWTVKRVRSVIEGAFDVPHSQTGCWQLLRELSFSLQSPEKRTAQRTEQATLTWKRRTWPRLKKKARREGRTIVFIDRGCRRSVRSPAPGPGAGTPR